MRIGETKNTSQVQPDPWFDDQPNYQNADTKVILAILVELIQSELDPCHPLPCNLCQWEAKSRPILKFRENISIFLSMREIRWSNVHLFASFKQRVQHIYFFNLSIFGTGKCVQPSWVRLFFMFEYFSGVNIFQGRAFLNSNLEFAQITLVLLLFVI